MSKRQEFLAKQEVILRLRHISKEYAIEGSNETVCALKNIHLCEEDETTNSRQERSGRSSAEKAAGETSEENNRSAGEEVTEPANNFRGFPPIRRGEFVMIRGPSGGGKTTLLNIIGTIDHSTSGTVELQDSVIGSDSTDAELSEIRLRKIGFVFQTFNLLASMTAIENVELPMTLLNKLSKKERKLRAQELLGLMGLRNRIHHLPSELSGGEQQRVTIARSLANNPSILLLDEPTGDLDTYNTIEVMDLLARLNRRTQCTLLMVTHNPDLECYADRILYVSDGKFVKQVINTEPQGLDYDKYTKYLEEREKEKTHVMRLGEISVSREV